MAKKEDSELTARYADMLSAMGTEPRLPSEDNSPAKMQR